MARRQHNPPQPQFDAFWFRLEACEALWECYEGEKIEPGRHVDVQYFGQFGLVDKFQAMGWDAMLSLDREMYPNLVRHFYCNLEAENTDMESFRLTSRVKGRDISFTCAELAQILGVSNDGDKEYCEPGTVARDFVNLEVQIEMFTTLQSRPLDEVILEVNYYPTPRIISKVVQYNVLPKGGHRGDPGIMEAYIVYCIYIGYQLCLPYIIMKRMLYPTYYPRSKNNLPYGRLLTKIFRHFGVDLQDEAMGQLPMNINDTMLKKIDQSRELSRYQGSPRLHVSDGPALVPDEETYSYLPPGYGHEATDYSREPRAVPMRDGEDLPVEEREERVPLPMTADPTTMASSSRGPRLILERIEQIEEDVAFMRRLMVDKFATYDHYFATYDHYFAILGQHLGIPPPAPPPPADQQPPLAEQ